MIRMGHAHIHSESPEQNSRSIKLHSHVRPKLKLYAIDFNPFLHDHTFHLYTFAGYSTLCPLYVMSRWQIFASLCLVVLVCNAISKGGSKSTLSVSVHGQMNRLMIKCTPSEDSDHTGHPHEESLGPLLLPIEALVGLGGCQADLNLRWAHSRFVVFVMRRLIYDQNGTCTYS